MRQRLPMKILAVLFMLVYAAGNAQTSPKRELRAAWIATVANIDWPSQKGLSVQHQQEEYVRILDTLQHIGMNAVVVQVRPAGDTFYPSSYEPWSEFLSGTQGESVHPYYNPLSFMIEQAKLRGLEFHAWFNPYRVTMKDQSPTAAQHIFQKYPEWFVSYGGKWYFDPGHPKAREFVLQAIMETVKHYDIDAVHFDDYFYPYRIANVDFPDSCSYADYGQIKFDNKDDWRRDNVDFFVEELSRRIKQEKPHVKFGISPFGVWRNKDHDADGSDTQAGQTNYDDLYADVLKWLQEGWIDYVTPQLYWQLGFKVADYRVLVKWWSEHTYGKHLYVGQGIYRIGGKGWEDPDEIVNQVHLNRTYSNVKGSMYFSAKLFLANKENVNEKMHTVYPHPALVPEMPWIKDEAPQPPSFLTAHGSQGNGIELQWRDSLSRSSAYYAVYRFKENEVVNVDDAANLIAVVQRKPYVNQNWIDNTTKKRTTYLYLVTSLNRLHNESEASHTLTLKTRGKHGKVKMH